MTCTCQPALANLQEDASDAAEQLHLLLGLILDDGMIRFHGQYVVLRDGWMKRGRKRGREAAALRETKKKLGENPLGGATAKVCVEWI